jgi:hypothetical protein
MILRLTKTHKNTARCRQWSAKNSSCRHTTYTSCRHTTYTSCRHTSCRHFELVDWVARFLARLLINTVQKRTKYPRTVRTVFSAKKIHKKSSKQWKPLHISSKYEKLFEPHCAAVLTMNTSCYTDKKSKWRWVVNENKRKYSLYVR